MSRGLSAALAALLVTAGAVAFTGGGAVAAQATRPPQAATAPSAPLQTPLRLSALAVRTEEPVATGSVDLTIERWTSDDDADRLLADVTEGGQARLLASLKAMPTIGRLASPGTVGIELRYARPDLVGQGQHRITIITDRWMSFGERWDGPRSTDYPFTIITIELNNRGEGKGQVSVATKVLMDRVNRTLVFENYENRPVLLQSVRRLTK